MKQNKEPKRYDFARKPKKPSKLWMWIANKFAIDPRLKGRPVTINKINMEGIEPPYLLLATHASMLDFPLMYKAVAPYGANNVVAIDAIRDVGDWLMRQLGCICKRKFVKDLHLIKNMKYSIETLGDIVCVYPEARYSFDGTTSFLPDSLGKSGKLMKVPVVVLRMYGPFISAPQWNKVEQHLPLRADLVCVANAEEVKTLSAAELNARIHKELQRDEYAWQKEEGIRNTYEKRAEGLHHILYQCPHCKKEFEMYTKGTKIWCNACKKVWEMSELGELHAEEGETEFSHIPDWMAWERQNVREEVESGRYRFEDEVTVHTLPTPSAFTIRAWASSCRRRRHAFTAPPTASPSISSGRGRSSRACTSSSTIPSARINIRRTSSATASTSRCMTTAIGCIPSRTARSFLNSPLQRRRSSGWRRSG